MLANFIFLTNIYNMPYLSWISDDDLKRCVQSVLDKALDAKRLAQDKFDRNVIDPFTTMFEIAGFGIDHNTWKESEQIRQAQKSLTNQIGMFHQNILGCVADWKDLSVGGVIDLQCEKKKVIAEVKNKHNTISGGKLKDLYFELQSLVEPKTSIYKGYTSYYVSIIPKNTIKFNTEFTPSNKETGTKCPGNSHIRKIDGASFYELVTGDKNALFDLFNILPQVIKDCSDKIIEVGDFGSILEYFTAAWGE